MIRALLAGIIFASGPLVAAELKIAVLHPLLGDLARKIGGPAVEVVDLIGPNGDPHHFEPVPGDLRRAEGAAIYFVAGMGLESYLPELKTILAGKARVIEVGATLPALEGVAAGHDDHEHGPDPHWWHSIDLFRRAAAVVADRFAEALPDKAGEFRKNADIYRDSLDELEKWARREIAGIPRDRRHLATAHAAFNYFCKDYGFTAHSIQGINREQMPGPARIAELVRELKEKKITAIFPERESNPKILKALTADTGLRLGGPLIADGTGAESYEAMFRHNVTEIVKGLSP